MTLWTAFPHANNPKIAIGPEDTVRNALRLYSPYQFDSRLAKALLDLTPGVLAKRCFPPFDPAMQLYLDEIAGSIRSTLDLPDAQISLSIGAPGADQKLTAIVRRKSSIVAFVKVATTSRAKALLQAERRQLERMQQLQLPCLLPRQIAYAETEVHALLALSPAAHGYRTAREELDRPKLAVLRELGNVSNPVDQLPNWMLPTGAITDVWFRAREYLVEYFSQNSFRTVLAHGDFTPWNILERRGSVPFVFDWEYGNDAYPALFDLFHYNFMVARLLQKQSPRDSVRSVLLRTLSGFGSEVIGGRLAAKETSAYMIAYLVLLRDRRVGAQVSSLLADCMHFALTAAGYAKEKLRVLVSAYACEPNKGSEPGVGWSMVNALANSFDVVVVTRSNNRTAIENALAGPTNANVKFIYADLPVWLRFWKRNGRWIRTYYYLWQFAALLRVRSELRNREFDVAHHITMVNDWIFTFLAFLRMPLVWGPVGTHPKLPAGMGLPAKVRITDHLRSYFQAAVRSVDPFYRWAVRKADLIVGIDAGVFARGPLREVPSERRHVHPAIGVEELVEKAPRKESAPLSVISIGRLVPLKGFDLSISAFAKAARENPEIRLKIIGDGPERERLEEQAKSMGIAEKVTFERWMKRDQALQMLASSDLFLFSSFEGGGMVVLEALMVGVPVVCLNYGGPGRMVVEGVGVAVPLSNRTNVLQAMSDAIIRFASDRSLLIATGANARNHVRDHYMWTAQAAQAANWYRRAIQNHERTHTLRLAPTVVDIDLS